MEQQQIAQKATKLIEKIMGIENIKADANFSQDYGADSLRLLELVAEIENELGIRIPNDRLSQFTTLKRTIEILEDLNQKQNPSQ